VRNATTQRTQAGTVARVLEKLARPGDLVVYCPDQIAPSVHRLAPRGLDEVVYPTFAGPQFVDWADYKRRLAHVDIPSFARQADARAGARPLWLVTAPGYITHPGTCERLSDALAARRARRQLTTPNEKIFEEPALQQFAPRAAGAQ
jgi:hypothetical protein